LTFIEVLWIARFIWDNIDISIATAFESYRVTLEYKVGVYK
jgi:hypothetical protein